MSYAFDFTCIVVLLGSLLRGYRRGFLIEVVEKVALMIGIIVAGIIHSIDSRWLGRDLFVFKLFLVIQFVLIVTGVSVSSLGLAKKTTLTAERTLLRPVNRIGGALVGVLKSCIVIGSMLLLLIHFPIISVSWAHRSVFAPFFLFCSRAVAFLLPNEFARSLQGLAASIPHG